jgi:hypothetical protein
MDINTYILQKIAVNTQLTMVPLTAMLCPPVRFWLNFYPLTVIFLVSCPAALKVCPHGGSDVEGKKEGTPTRSPDFPWLEWAAGRRGYCFPHPCNGN